MPTSEQVLDAVQSRGPVMVAGKAHWATGWRHWLASSAGVGEAATVGSAAADEDSAHDAVRLDEQGAALLSGLDAVLRQQVARAQQDFGGQASVAEVTRWLTETIAGWAYGQESARERRWKVFRELSLPLAPSDSTRFGRLDLTVLPCDGRDLIVELDSTHKATSIEKLLFARDAGALAVWLRWHGGRVEQPEGVLVLDLVEDTRGLAS